MPEIEKLTLSVPEAAEALGVSRAQAYIMVNSGELPSIRVGRRRLVPLDKLRLWIDGREEGEREAQR